MNRPGGEIKTSDSGAGFDYSDFESAMSKFDTTFQVNFGSINIGVKYGNSGQT